MIIFRHHRGGLAESMATKKEFQTFEDLQKYIVDYLKPHLNLIPKDIVALGEIHCDKRIGWEDVDYLCIAGYNEVSDKKGVEKYFGGKYYTPQCIGMFATKYPKEEYIKH